MRCILFSWSFYIWFLLGHSYRKFTRTPDQLLQELIYATNPPFENIKAWMGATHFLTKGLERMSTEMSLHVLTYNFRRSIAIPGIVDIIRAIKAFIHLDGLKAALWLIDLVA